MGQDLYGDFNNRRVFFRTWVVTKVTVELEEVSIVDLQANMLAKQNGFCYVAVEKNARNPC